MSEEQQDLLEEGLYEQLEIIVDPKQSALRIDKFLMDRLEKATRNRIQNAIRSGLVLVDGKEVKPNLKIKPGQQIKVFIPKFGNNIEGVIPQDIPLDIRYEDEVLMVVHKPAGMVVHPGIGNHSGTLVNALAYYYKGQALPLKEEGFRDRMGLVHRIDKETSGLLVIAKTDEAMSHLAKQFFDHTTERTYWALVWGDPEPEAGSIEGNIGRDERQRKIFTVYPEGDYGKWAKTHYKTMESMYYVSLIECKLETGRTHQIRVHMKYLGHPLFNDSTYGGNQIVKGTVFSKYKQFVQNCFKIMPRQALHAKSLGFVHPQTGEKMHFEADLPEDFSLVLEKWRNYLNSKKAAKKNIE